MATVIRAEVSTKNKYWIPKHRHYELKHFCLQYPFWKKEYTRLDCSNLSAAAPIMDYISSTNTPSDPTGKYVLIRDYYRGKIKLIEEAAKNADEFLYSYIIKAVTEGLSFTYLQTVMGIPCSRDTYYDRYRKFFWLLSKSRD